MDVSMQPQEVQIENQQTRPNKNLFSGNYAQLCEWSQLNKICSEKKVYVFISMDFVDFFHVEGQFYISNGRLLQMEKESLFPTPSQLTFGESTLHPTVPVPEI